MQRRASRVAIPCCCACWIALIAAFLTPGHAAQRVPRGASKTVDPLLTLTHANGVYALAFSPDGTRLLTGGADLTVRLWEIPTGKELQKIEGSRASDFTFDFAWSTDGQSVLIRGGQYAGAERMVLWDVDEWREAKTFDGLEGPPRSVALSVDGRRAVAGSQQGVVSVFDAETGKLVSRYQPKVDPSNMFANNINFPDASTNCVDIAADGRRGLWTGGYSNFQIHVFEIESGRHIADLGGTKLKPADLEPSIVDARFAGDGERIFIADSQGSLRVWSGGNKLSAPAKVATRPVRSVSFSKDQEFALVGVCDGELTLWRIGEFQRNSKALEFVVQFQPPRPAAQLSSPAGKAKGGIIRVTLSDDNRFAAAADYDGTVRVWDLSRLDTE